MPSGTSQMAGFMLGWMVLYDLWTFEGRWHLFQGGIIRSRWLAAVVLVTESARACSYTLSKQVQETCQFWLLTFLAVNVLVVNHPLRLASL